mgnify:CR=1 FL=1
MFEHFYNEIFRSVIISFGSLFNGIEVHKKDADNDTFSIIKVPLSYGPTQKFLARMEQQADLNKPVQMTLPRMSFEMTGIAYDGTRKTQPTKMFKTTDRGKKLQKVYLPVPYNVTFELSIMSKLNEDCLQIIEQILPYFQPAYTTTVDLVEEIGEKRDIPIVLNSINFTDDYEGDFSSRRLSSVGGVLDWQDVIRGRERTEEGSDEENCKQQ